MIFNKKYTYEQHDNEKGSFYNNSIKPLNSKDILDQNIEVDVCVVGGGLTGISSALNLSKKGYSVVLCEARKVGWGASGRNGGQLGIGMRKDQREIEKKDHEEQIKQDRINKLRKKKCRINNRNNKFIAFAASEPLFSS